MSVKLILKEGELEYAILPHEVYMRRVAVVEMLEDIRDYDTAAAGNSPSYLSQLETGKWTGTA